MSSYYWPPNIAASGNVSGTGSSGQVAFWSNATTITGSSGLTYDGNNLKIVASSSTIPLTLQGGVGGGIGGIQLYRYAAASGNYNWFVANGYTSTNQFEITPSNATDSTTPGSPTAKFRQTGQVWISGGLEVGASAEAGSSAQTIGYFNSNQNQGTILEIANSSSGASAYAQLRIYNDTTYMFMEADGSNNGGGSAFIGANSGFNSLHIQLGGNKPLTLDTNSVTRLTATGLGSIVIGGSALATNATDGFLYLPTCAGTPTGVPTAQSATKAVVYDTTANKIWVYNGSWRGIVVV